MTDLLLVEKVDREAAERMYRFVQNCMKAEKRHSDDVIEAVSSEILLGRWDKDESVQAFTRHRIAGFKQGIEAAAKVVEEQKTCGCNGAHGRCMEDDPYTHAANTIRTLSPPSIADDGKDGAE